MLLAATTTCLLLLLLLLGSASAKGNGHAFRPVPLSSRVQFPNFQSTDLLHLFGSASSYHRKAVRLTSAEHSAGALILRTPVVLLDRPGNSANSSACRALAWSSVFSFRVSGPADGFAMVLRPRRAVMRGRMNLCAVLKKPGFFVGFTASSAASPAVHDILSWTFAVAPCERQSVLGEQVLQRYQYLHDEGEERCQL
ncbi:hypothetical protein CLOP_g21661 [Closterium sp. NIES-67]|nr:hypothetical protein CLOP_g21661 [Closterium sp. NIES-67]